MPVRILSMDKSPGGNAFGIVQAPTGTSPTADSPTDTLTLTSLDGTVDILGNSSTDTLDFSTGPDISRGTAVPTDLGSATTTGGTPTGVSVYAPYVYVVSFTGGSNFLDVFDISTPTTPTLVKTFTTGLTSLAGAFRLTKFENTLITAAGGRVTAFDVSDAASPSVSSLFNSTTLGGITVSGAVRAHVNGNLLFLFHTGNLRIFEIVDPTTVLGYKPLSTITTSSPQTGFAVKNKYLYFINNGAGARTLTAYDISDPTSPLLAGTLDLKNATYGDPGLNAVYDIFATESYLFLYGTSTASAAGGMLMIIDIRDPTSFTPANDILWATDLGTGAGFLPSMDLYFPLVICDGDTSALGNTGVHAYNVQDPTNVTFLSYIGTPSAGALPAGMVLSGRNLTQVDLSGVFLADVSGETTGAALIYSLQAGKVVTDILETRGTTTLGNVSVRNRVDVGQDIAVGGNSRVSGSLKANEVYDVLLYQEMFS